MWKTIWRILFLFFFLSNCSHEEKHTPNPYADDIPSEQKVHIVEIKQMKFEPNEVHIHRGDKVMWVNHDLLAHDVTEEARKLWSSSTMSVGASWSMTFTQSSDYYCSIHVVMKGKVIVD